MGVSEEEECVVSETLSDPTKPAHEIIEVLEDGDAIRNDGVRLTAANKNPWYVLATIYGEQEEGAIGWDYNEGLAQKNRDAWNLWFCHELSDEDLQDRAKKVGLQPEELVPFKDGKRDDAAAKKALAALRRKIIKQLKAVKAKNQNPPDPTQNIDFSKIYFSRYANFEKYIFEKSCVFSSATFTGYAYFRSATFTGDADFRSATFTGYAYFNRVSSFEDGAQKPLDQPTVFERQAVFSAAKFKSTTTFEEARFLTHVPEFHAAELYDDTAFTLPDDYQENWPPLTGDGVMRAEKQKKAYNRLRLYMNKSLQIDEEQFFHRMEMRCKRETEGWRYRWIYTLFEGVSDYGNSVLRPAGWLFVIWLSGMIAKLEAVKDGWWPDVWSIGPAMCWSFANLFSFFGFYRRYFKNENLEPLLQVFSGMQTVFGFVLVFMLGLGLRNRFRLR